MSRLSPSLLSLVCLGFMSGAAQAQVPSACPSPAPKKTIRIVNNTTNSVLYAFIQSPIFKNEKQTDADLWMQAQCGINDWVNIGSQQAPLCNSQRKFTTTRLYRAYILINNSSNGIAHGNYVDVTVPFYTQLKSIPANRLGLDPDQYIDWWNANRIYMFDTAAAFNSAMWTNQCANTNCAAGGTPAPGGNLPQPVVNPVGGAEPPTCVSSDGATCTIVLKQAAVNVPDGVPFQLQEYTGGSAEGPPNDNKVTPQTCNPDVYHDHTCIRNEYVNYNVSSLTLVFMSVAMEPLGRNDTEFVGSAMTVPDMRTAISAFSNNGGNWPYYVPTYFDSKQHQGFNSSVSYACSVSVPFPSDYTFPPYNLPKIPGTYNVFTESYSGAPGSDGANPPIPPILSSNPANWQTVYGDHHCSPPSVPPFVDPPALGTLGQKVKNLWDLCLNGISDTSQACMSLRDLKICSNLVIPQIVRVRGWFLGGSWRGQCMDGSRLITRAARGQILRFSKILPFVSARTCELQYNYLDPKVKVNPKYLFNPYTALIYSPVSSGGLGSSAYAFSIDDALSFKHVEAGGMIIAVGGATGLGNPNGQKIPENMTEALQHCRQATTSVSTVPQIPK